MSQHRVLGELQHLEYLRAYLATANPKLLDDVAEKVTKALNLMVAAAEQVEERAERNRAHRKVITPMFLAPPAA